MGTEAGQLPGFGVAPGARVGHVSGTPQLVYGFGKQGVGFVRTPCSGPSDKGGVGVVVGLVRGSEGSKRAKAAGSVGLGEEQPARMTQARRKGAGFMRRS